MFNLNRTNRNALISIFTLITVIFVIGILKQSSKYQPKPIVIKASNEESIFSLPNDIACTPGFTADGSTYTKALTPGGLCGSEGLVASQAGGYEIEDGIGGSLI
jgi:hypothetical protein